METTCLDCLLLQSPVFAPPQRPTPMAPPTLPVIVSAGHGRRQDDLGDRDRRRLDLAVSVGGFPPALCGHGQSHAKPQRCSGPAGSAMSLLELRSPDRRSNLHASARPQTPASAAEGGRPGVWPFLVGGSGLYSRP